MWLSFLKAKRKTKMKRRKDTRLQIAEVTDRESALKIAQAANDVGNVAVHVGANEGGIFRKNGHEYIIAEGAIGLGIFGKRGDIKKMRTTVKGMKSVPELHILEPRRAPTRRETRVAEGILGHGVGPIAERKHWQGVNQQLGALKDHLLVVTNFDGYETRAKEIAKAIQEAGFSTDTPIGFTDHANEQMRDRANLSHEYQASALAISSSLSELGYSHVDNHSGPVESQRGYVAHGIAEGALITRSHLGRPADEVLHIAVTSAIDTPEIGIPYQAGARGNAFMYRGAGSDSKPDWQELAALPVRRIH
jgi:hypothetical protein